MKKRILAIFLAVSMLFSVCTIVNAAMQIESGEATLPEKSWIIDGGFETARYINEDEPANKKTYIPTFTATEDAGNSTERPAKNAQIMDEEGFAAEGEQCLLLAVGENLTIKIPNLAQYKGHKIVLKYYVRAKTGTSGYGTWGRIDDRSVMEDVSDGEGGFIKKPRVVYAFRDDISYWDNPNNYDYYGKWTLISEKFIIPDTVTSTSEYVFIFGCYGVAMYYDGISCVIEKADGTFVDPSELPNTTPDPNQTPTPTPTNEPTASTAPTKGPTGPLTDRAVARDGATWTAREVPEGTVVTVPPIISNDPDVETAVILGGGFEYPAGWVNELQRRLYWWDAGDPYGDIATWQPWSRNTEEKIEGTSSACVDVSSAMAELSGVNPARLPHLGFDAVFVVPCFKKEVYRLRFYAKVDRELGEEDPQIGIFFYDPMTDDPQAKFKDTVGTINVPLDKMSVDAHWYDQNQVKFIDGSNPSGAFQQGEGPFAQGKWIQIDSYFVTPEDFVENGYSVMIQTKETADCKIYFDAFSLEKVTLDEVDLGIKLINVATPTPVVTATTSPTLTPTPTVGFSETPEPTARPTKKPVKKSVKFTKKSIKIKRGKKATLKVAIKGAKKAKFSVDKKGMKVVKLMNKKAKSVVVKGKKKGKAVITAKVGSKKAKCKVTVK